MAMNVSFFLLILTLFALAFLTKWNQHVLIMLAVTTCLWAAMVWFVLEITKVQTRPDNMPLSGDLLPASEPDPKPETEIQTEAEGRKDR
ncbi:hypothetical protein BCR39DRAFT_513904 [Naematelia encephala]|uniref:Uncharacterized protein n=1 Tax=Naematelia encephala TaxID=71784 RepID=A0A1Y2BIP8_9TREE|nr:hypothetical protein BCR39DRAFT_513904 [Naematelia encephala]